MPMYVHLLLGFSRTLKSRNDLLVENVMLRQHCQAQGSRRPSQRVRVGRVTYRHLMAMSDTLAEADCESAEREVTKGTIA
jgi:hypothetical protein